MGVFQIKIPKDLVIRDDQSQTQGNPRPADLTPYEGSNPTFHNFSIGEKSIVEMCLPLMHRTTS